MKICKKCELKLSNDFFRTLKSDGYTYLDCMCKNCRNKYHRDYAAKRRKNTKMEAVQYKGGACICCNIQDEDTSIYDFHHLDPNKKEFGIGAIDHYIFKDIKNELDKCVLVCANCHRKLHTGSITL